MARTPELMTQSRAASFLGVTRETVRKWHKGGGGPPRKRLGKRYWYSREALKEWLKERGPPASGIPTPRPHALGSWPAPTPLRGTR